MRRFRFRLEKVLSLRKREENTVRQELARMNHEITRVQMEIERIERALKSSDVSCELARYPEIPPGEVVRRHQGHLTALETRLRQAREAETRLFEQRNEINRKLVEARKDRAAVQKLKERELKRHRQEMEKEERKEMDEVASRRHAGKDRGQFDASSGEPNDD